jgi:hypothetical protein
MVASGRATKSERLTERLREREEIQRERADIEKRESGRAT